MHRRASKPMNLTSSVNSSADSQSASPKTGVDLLCAKDPVQKKAATSDNTTQSAGDSQQPQMFDEVLSNAATVQKPDVKTTTAKTKASPTDASSLLKKIDEPATPDIALLMSLLNVLPQASTLPATSGQRSSLAVPDDAVATAAISSATAGRVTPAPASTNTLATTPTPTPATPDDALKSSGPIVLAAALSSAPTEVAPTVDSRATDKTDLFASILANIEAPTTVPPTATLLAIPTQQTSTLTAVAQALPVTAPGVLDELPITHGEWPAALGHRLLWAVGEGMQKVEISVNPQDMGPINVHIRIENDKTDIRFTAVHAVTRDALEASIPRLRDMFSQQGLNLSQAQVFSQTSQDPKGRQPDTPPAFAGTPSSDTSADAKEPELPRVIHWRRGLVDDYA